VGSQGRLDRAPGQLHAGCAHPGAGYLECAPFLGNIESLFGTGQLPKFAETLFKTGRQRSLADPDCRGCPVTHLYRDELLDETKLPLRPVGLYTVLPPSESGSYGKECG